MRKTLVTNEGMKIVKGFAKLKELNLDFTAVTYGVKQLEGLPWVSRMSGA